MLREGFFCVWGKNDGVSVFSTQERRTDCRDGQSPPDNDSRFWKIFAIPVVLHGIWDAPIFEGYLKLVALIIMVWIVVLILINMGLDEVKKLKMSQDETMQ